MSFVTKRRVLIYARCSTSHQDQKPEVQIQLLREYCLARGWEIIEELVDHGYSGSTDKRPGLKRLQELVRQRKVDVVVVVKLDRLFRSVSHLLQVLTEWSDLSVEFISLKDQIDMTTASGRLMLHIIAAFAEFERELCKERVALGVAHAIKQGKRIGRPQEHDYEKINELHKAGKSLRAIQREIGCSIGSVYRAIQSAPKAPSKNDQNDEGKTRG